MDAIKIVGEWRRGGDLEPGQYLWRHQGSAVVGGAAHVMEEMEEDGFRGSGSLEYLGPIEIVDPEPVPTPLPGGKCVVGEIDDKRWFSRSEDRTSQYTDLIAFGATKREAILRHNAAVAAIVAMEGGK